MSFLPLEGIVTLSTYVTKHKKKPVVPMAVYKPTTNPAPVLVLPVMIKKGASWNVQLYDPDAKVPTLPSGASAVKNEWMEPGSVYMVYKVSQVPPVPSSRLTNSNLPTSTPYMIHMVDPQGNLRYTRSRTPLEGCVWCGMFVVVT